MLSRLIDIDIPRRKKVAGNFLGFVELLEQGGQDLSRSKDCNGVTTVYAHIFLFPISIHIEVITIFFQYLLNIQQIELKTKKCRNKSVVEVYWCCPRVWISLGGIWNCISFKSVEYQFLSPPLDFQCNDKQPVKQKLLSNYFLEFYIFLPTTIRSIQTGECMTNLSPEHSGASTKVHLL